MQPRAELLEGNADGSVSTAYRVNFPSSVQFVHTFACQTINQAFAVSMTNTSLQAKNLEGQAEKWHKSMLERDFTHAEGTAQWKRLNGNLKQYDAYLDTMALGRDFRWVSATISASQCYHASRLLFTQIDLRDMAPLPLRPAASQYTV